MSRYSIHHNAKILEHQILTHLILRHLLLVSTPNPGTFNLSHLIRGHLILIHLILGHLILIQLTVGQLVLDHLLSWKISSQESRDPLSLGRSLTLSRSDHVKDPKNEFPWSTWSVPFLTTYPIIMLKKDSSLCQRNPTTTTKLRRSKIMPQAKNSHVLWCEQTLLKQKLPVDSCVWKEDNFRFDEGIIQDYDEDSNKG